jgi:hypothetical protein
MSEKRGHAAGGAVRRAVRGARWPAVTCATLEALRMLAGGSYQTGTARAFVIWAERLKLEVRSRTPRTRITITNEWGP